MPITRCPGRRRAGPFLVTAGRGCRVRGAGGRDNAGVARASAGAVRRIGIRLSALARDGLTYAAGDYDRDRYRQLSQLAAGLLAAISGRPAGELVGLGRDPGYATPKVEVRGVIFDDSERVLLMRERADGRWSLPGGWADPGEAPSAAAAREILEETGYHSSAVKLIACWDRELQDNPPPLPVHVCKLFFLCRRDGAVQPPAALETLDVSWSGLGSLPPLSLGRVSPRQLDRAPGPAPEPVPAQRVRLTDRRTRRRRTAPGSPARPTAQDAGGDPSAASPASPDHAQTAHVCAAQDFTSHHSKTVHIRRISRCPEPAIITQRDWHFRARAS